MPTALLLEPEYSFQLAERNVASEYAAFARIESERDEDAIRTVRLSAVILEVMLVGVCVQETFHEAGITTVDEAARTGVDLAQAVRDRCGLVVEDIAADVMRYLPIRTIDPDIRLEAASLSRLVRLLRSSLELCPIRYIERIGLACGQERWAHRARVAYDALAAFLLRSDPNNQQQLRLVGQKYAEGVLTVDEVATLLKIEPVDAAFFLEAWGYARSIERIRLDPTERARILERLRSDRLERNGKPAFDAGRAYRDTIASERIEEVDARQWIPRAVP
jgi:hypothetical protein